MSAIEEVKQENANLRSRMAKARAIANAEARKFIGAGVVVGAASVAAAVRSQKGDLYQVFGMDGSVAAALVCVVASLSLDGEASELAMAAGVGFSAEYGAHMGPAIAARAAAAKAK